jgi:hypothetical protein
LKPDLLIIDQGLGQGFSADCPLVFLNAKETQAPSSGSKISYLKKPFDSQGFLMAIQHALAADQRAPAKVSAPLPPMEGLRAPASPSPTLNINQDEIRQMARKVIEEIAWEVVPELAESIIREEIRRLTQK